MIADLRLTWRALRRSPGFAAMAVATLAICIGINAGTFSIVSAIALRGLPFPESERLLAIEMAKPSVNEAHSPLSQEEFLDLREQQRSFEGISAFAEASFMVSGPGGDPERAGGCLLAGPGTALLRVTPHLGRWFEAVDDRPGAPSTVVLGHALWENRFQSDPAIVGQQIRIDGEWTTVVGVAGKDFCFPVRAQLWKPWRFVPTDGLSGIRRLSIFGRLKADADLRQARAEFLALSQRWALDHPRTNRGVILTLRELGERYLDDTTRRLLALQLAAVFFVLLIGCANLANLQLARAVVRQREIAIRVALGATRGQIVRLLLLESAALSAGGGLIGLVLTEAMLESFRRDLASIQPPHWMVPHLDGAGVAWVVGLAVTSTIFAGLYPAWRVSRPDFGALLNDGGRGATGFALSRFTRWMIVGEIAVSCVLLVLATLATRAVIHVQSAPLGYETAGIFTHRIDLPERAYPEPGKARDFYGELLARLGARPEVAAVAVSSTQPTWGLRDRVELEGSPRGEAGNPDFSGPEAARAEVSGGYFSTLGIRLVAGRTFDDHDTPSSRRVAIVSTRFAEKYWPGEDPLGKRLAFGSRPGVKPADWLTVVGVVTPTLQGDYRNDTSDLAQAYVTYTQAGGRNMTIFTKARSGDATALAPVVRAVVRSIDADQPVFWPQTLAQMVEQAKFLKKLLARTFGFFGLVALSLTLVGLYSVMSYVVARRTHEIGVRMALGAQRGEVVALILRQGGGQILLGLLLGLPAAFFGGRLLAAVLYSVNPDDPATLAVAAIVLGVAGFGACLVPALRAVRVVPVEALRCE